MPYLKCSVIITILVIFLIRISENKCRIRLIQRLDSNLTGLSFIVVAGGKSYMFKENINSMTPIDLPKHFEIPTGTLVYYNDECKPPRHYLLLYKTNVENGNVVHFKVSLDLVNWNISRQWSTASKGLPDFLTGKAINDPLPKAITTVLPIDFSMLWNTKKSLYIIQRKKGMEPDRQYDYITIKFGNSGDRCEGFELFVDNQKKWIADALGSWNDYESCFVLKDKQIICFGPKGFTSYDMNLTNFKDGNIRVENETQLTGISVAKALEQIEKIANECEDVTVAPTPLASNDTSEDTSEGTSEGTSTATEDISASTKPGDKSSAIIWIILVLIFLAIVVLVLSLCYWCRKSADRKDGGAPESGAPTTGQPPKQMADEEMSRVRLNEGKSVKNPTVPSEKTEKDSAVTSGVSMRSKLDDKTNANKQ